MNAISTTRVLLLAIPLAAGCATTGRPGQIPLGKWTGDGHFVYEHWKSDEEGDSDDAVVSLARGYSTELTIRPAKLDGRDVVKIEVISRRGSLPGFDDSDRTHLRAALAEVKRISDTTVLYRLLDCKLNERVDAELEIDEDAPPVAASCMTTGGVTVLQIQYEDSFADTYRFTGRRLEKTGAYANADEGLIQWWERLTKRD